MKDWTQEVDEYAIKVKGMTESEAYYFIWQEYYFKHRLSRRAHDWLSMFMEDILARQ